MYNSVCKACLFFFFARKTSCIYENAQYMYLSEKKKVTSGQYVANLLVSMFSISVDKVDRMGKDKQICNPYLHIFRIRNDSASDQCKMHEYLLEKT